MCTDGPHDKYSGHHCAHDHSQHAEEGRRVTFDDGFALSTQLAGLGHPVLIDDPRQGDVQNRRKGVHFPRVPQGNLRQEEHAVLVQQELFAGLNIIDLREVIGMGRDGVKDDSQLPIHAVTFGQHGNEW